MNSVILIADSLIYHAPFAIVLLLQNYDLILGKCFDWIGHITRPALLVTDDDPCLLFDSTTKCPHLLIRLDMLLLL